MCRLASPPASVGAPRVELSFLPRSKVRFPLVIRQSRHAVSWTREIQLEPGFEISFRTHYRQDYAPVLQLGGGQAQRSDRLLH